MRRREFMLTAGTMLVGAALGGCAPKSAQREAPNPAATPREKSRVAIVSTEDRAFGVREAVRVFGENRVQGKQVLLKPNYNNPDPAPGSTHPDVLRELITVLREQGAKSVTIGERSGGGRVRDTVAVLEQAGVFKLAKELDVPVINFQEADQWVPFKREGLHWKDGFLYAKAIADAESVVSTCCLKTHGDGGIFTLSLKLSVGIVPRQGYTYMNELHSSANQREMIAEINLAYQPDLIVVDGVQAFVSGGPNTGGLATGNVLFAGRDRVAVDAVGVALLKLLGTTPAIMDKKIYEQDQIARAVALGLGAPSPADIELVADDAQSKALAAKVREILDKG